MEASEVNKTTEGDIFYKIVKTGLSVVPIPVLAPAAAELIDLVVSPPLETRRVEWMNYVSEKLRKLEADGKLDLQKLKDNEQFISVIVQTTAIALKTEEKEKIESLKNALINTALGDSPNSTKTQIFLGAIERFTTWHIRLLKFLDNPKAYFEINGTELPSYSSASLWTIIKIAFPTLKEEESLVSLIWNDLKSNGFHETGDMRTSMTRQGLFAKRTNRFASEFLEFIENRD